MVGSAQMYLLLKILSFNFASLISLSLLFWTEAYFQSFFNFETLRVFNEEANTLTVLQIGALQME